MTIVSPRSNNVCCIAGSIAGGTVDFAGARGFAVACADGAGTSSLGTSLVGGAGAIAISDAGGVGGEGVASGVGDAAACGAIANCSGFCPINGAAESANTRIFIDLASSPVLLSWSASAINRPGKFCTNRMPSGVASGISILADTSISSSPAEYGN